MNRTAELVSTGAELLSGRSVNTHARLLGERLGRLGIALARDTTVQDDVAVIREAIDQARHRVDLVFVSGGLGPTNDDVTRDALAALLQRRVVLDGPSLDLLRTRMERVGLAMNPARERQALVLEGAVALSNAAGAAPGQRLEQDGTVYFVLPGPPAEFQAILDDHVVPWLTGRLGGAAALRERILLVHGLGEADVVERFEQAGFPPPGVTTAYCAGPARLELRLHPGPGVDDAELDQAADRAAGLLSGAVYARERIDLEVLVGRLLTERGRTLATAESCTGGLIGERVTAVPGSSAYYRGGVITYADEAKVRELGVDAGVLQRDGAVSAAVAQAMAEGVRARFGSDLGVAVTGIAGPGGGTEEKPVGLVFVAVADGTGVDVQRRVFPGNRQTIRERTARAALLLCWSRLTGTAGGR